MYFALRGVIIYNIVQKSSSPVFTNFSFIKQAGLYCEPSEESLVWVKFFFASKYGLFKSTTHSPFTLLNKFLQRKFVSFDFPVAHFVGLIELLLYKVRQVMLDFEEFPLPAAPGAAGGAGGGAAADALGAL